MSINGWIDNQNVVYIYNEKGMKFDLCYNINETWGHYAKWNKSVKITNAV